MCDSPSPTGGEEHEDGEEEPPPLTQEQFDKHTGSIVQRASSVLIIKTSADGYNSGMSFYLESQAESAYGDSGKDRQGQSEFESIARREADIQTWIEVINEAATMVKFSLCSSLCRCCCHSRTRSGFCSLSALPVSDPIRTTTHARTITYPSKACNRTL